MSHIVQSCPLTKLNGGLPRLHSSDEDAVSWPKWFMTRIREEEEEAQSTTRTITNSAAQLSRRDRAMFYVIEYSLSYSWSLKIILNHTLGCKSLLVFPCNYV